jgi:hypothetical protein
MLRQLYLKTNSSHANRAQIDRRVVFARYYILSLRTIAGAS